MAKRMMLARNNTRPFMVGDERVFAAGWYGWLDGMYAATIHPLRFDSEPSGLRDCVRRMVTLQRCGYSIRSRT
jgi:hypothetical protein